MPQAAATHAFMLESRKTLGLRSDTRSVQEKDAAARDLLAQAIDHLLCVRWTYNRVLIQAAPQILYLRNDHLYCDGVVLEKKGVRPLETKVAAFRLAGLSNIALMGETFRPEPIDLANPRYAQGILARAQ
jgi:hypothetical protein